MTQFVCMSPRRDAGPRRCMKCKHQAIPVHLAYNGHSLSTLGACGREDQAPVKLALPAMPYRGGEAHDDNARFANAGA